MKSGNGTRIPMDMVVVNGGGAKTSSLTPGAAQKVQFQLPPDAKLNPHNNWACFDAIWVSVSTTFDQASSGGSAVNADQLPAIIKSFRFANNDLFGVMIDDQVATGPVAKNIMERVSNGYENAAWDRAQIASTDGDSTVTLYFKLPLGTANVDTGPEAFMHWLGFHKNAVLDVTLDVSTAIAQFSTGAVIKSATVIKAWVTPVALRNPPLPLLARWKRYLSPVVSAGNAITMRNVGEAQGLTNASKQMRIASLFEIMNVLGLGGVSTADTITSFLSDQLNQPKVDNVEAFMLAFRDLIGGHVGAANLHDGAGFPHTMAATPNGSMQVATLLFLAWRFSTPRQQIANLMRWPVPADLTYYRDQASGGPSSGQHLILTQEIHEADLSAVATMRKMAGPVLAAAPPEYSNPRAQANAKANKYADWMFASPRVFKVRG